MFLISVGLVIINIALNYQKNNFSHILWGSVVGDKQSNWFRIGKKPLSARSLVVEGGCLSKTRALFYVKIGRQQERK